MSARPLLEASGLRKRFGDVEVLDDIGLTVHQGEFVSILGPSGAGKSTLLQILIGCHTADAGTIRFDGTPLDQHRQPFAYMPQRDALMPWRRILDNLTLGLEVQNVPRKIARARVRPLLAEFGLEGFERHWPTQLSGGMRQRAALMRTVLQERRMLLLDEPFGALDALTRVRMQRWLKGLWRHHDWTALLITHDVTEAVFLSDRIYILSARPARVIRDIGVPLPPLRDRMDGSSDAARSVEREVLDALLHTAND